MYNRKKTSIVNVGGVLVGGNNPISIQSMCNTDTFDVLKTVKQIHALEECGCEIVRVAALNLEIAEKLAEIKKQIHIPLVADVHFDYRIAVKAIEQGVDKIRINPGNIGSLERVQKVVNAAKDHKIPIRIGVNGGSLEKELLTKYGKITDDALCESAMNHVRILEQLDFDQIIISIKTSSVPLTYEAYAKLSELVNYPLHLGITEAGSLKSGTVKSAVGIGAILAAGIGDTIRVSLTSDPVEEIYVAKNILKALDLRKDGIEVISCPTCGRTKIDLIPIAEQVEKMCENIKKNLKVAVMGCAVNGPGEAKDADIGVAAGDGFGIVFRKGVIIKKVAENEIINTLMEEIYNM